MPDQIERRGSPRAELLVSQRCRVELRHWVQLLDISQWGALLGGGTDLTPGTRGRLRSVGVLRFSVEVAVRRHQPPTTLKRQTALGVQFIAMDERSRESLEQFLRRRKEKEQDNGDRT